MAKNTKDAKGRSPKIKVTESHFGQKNPSEMTDAEVLKELAEIRAYYVRQGYTG